MPIIVAMPGPEYFQHLYVGLMLLLAAAARFVGQTAARRGERRRRANLGWVALVAGPAIGATLALLAGTMIEISPLDFWHHVGSFMVVGMIAGMIAAIFFACSVALARTPKTPPKEAFDDLS